MTIPKEDQCQRPSAGNIPLSATGLSPPDYPQKHTCQRDAHTCKEQAAHIRK
jgi:hypothetical protein